MPMQTYSPRFIRVFFLILISSLFSTAATAEAATPASGTSKLRDRIRRTFQTIAETPSPAPSLSTRPTAMNEMPPHTRLTATPNSPALPSEELAFFRFGAAAHEVSHDTASDDEPTFPFFTQGDRLFVQDHRARRILVTSPYGKAPTLFMEDPRRLLQFADACVLPDQACWIADNSRQSVFLFEKHAFSRKVGYSGDRAYFQNIRRVFADASGNLLGVYDSAKNLGFVFSRAGELLWETPGPIQPVFWGENLLRLRISGQTLTLLAVFPNAAGEKPLLTYSPAPGHVLLDAWVVGVHNQRLFLVTAEGIGDEDHPAPAVLLVLSQGKVSQYSLPASLDLEAGLETPYAVLTRGAGAFLVESFATEEGIGFTGYPVPE